MKAEFQYNWIGNFLVFLLAVICVLFVVLKSNQASLSKPLLQTFTGEYSRDGEIWVPLDDNADLNALDGDLFLRGHLSYDSIGGGGFTTRTALPTAARSASAPSPPPRAARSPSPLPQTMAMSWTS